jgi:hypothetical protein
VRDTMEFQPVVVCSFISSFLSSLVCTDPGSRGVSISSWTNNLCDGACVLYTGDHAFIRHQSWIVIAKPGWKRG